jgi:hypothetical protein
MAPRMSQRRGTLGLSAVQLIRASLQATLVEKSITVVVAALPGVPAAPYKANTSILRPRIERSERR